MKSVFALTALVAAASAQIGTFDEDGYMDLPSIPGMDFVGFGYDVRYLDDTNQGLRLPMMEFTFSEKKTYRYPLYKDRKYKIPDELFVRTVGTATAENVVFSTIEEYKENWAAKLGFNYTKSSMTPEVPTDVNTTNGASGAANEFNSSATPDASNTNSRTEGYGDLLPAKYSKTASGVFEVGVDFQFRKNMLRDSSPLQMSVHNTQTHQLYQLMVNKNKIRTHMQADINNLKTKQFATEPDAFRSFFEKYGTHYVQTAMLGGAIELASIISNVAETDFIQTTANLSVLSDRNSSTSQDNITTDDLVDKSPLCTGLQAGWSYNKVKGECQTPVALECYAPMPEEDYVEKFDYKMDDEQNHNFIPLNVTVEGRAEAYKAFPWRRGPLTGLTRDCVSLRGGAKQCNFEVPSHFYFTDANTFNTGRENVLVVDAFTQSANSEMTGISRLFKSGTPQLIMWDMFLVQVPSDTTYGLSSATIQFAYEGDQYTDVDDRGLWTMDMRGSGNNLKSFATISVRDFEPGQNQVQKDHAINRGEWVSFKLVINWETYTSDLWFKEAAGDWILSNLKDVKLRHKKPNIDRVDIWNYARGSARTQFDSMQWCNSKGAKYAPVSRNVAAQKAASTMKQRITGNLDFGFESENSNKKIQESSNYKVKGGDTSIVDLLNLRAKQETFRDWKASIPQNPAPVSFTLREISSIFSKEPVEITAEASSNGKRQTDIPVEAVTVIPRNEMRKATQAFLVTVEKGDIVYPTAADTPPLFTAPLGQV